MGLLVLVEGGPIPQGEKSTFLGGEDSGDAEISRELVMKLLGRSLEMAVRDVKRAEFTDIKLRHKPAELAEWERVKGHRPNHRNSHILNRISSLQSTKRACFWKYCV
ncbi:urotensin-2B-like [Heptranchias perlo]|uniref:urotensin-2B-like n=1 Tax=Heptranchias perlo TaxID=212740 RepID=UPI0035598A71